MIGDNGAMNSGLGIVETARRAAHAQWIEERIFETLGAWSTSVPEPEAGLLFARHASHHAWHAQLWAERRPELRERSVDGPLDERWIRFVAALRAPADDRTVLKLAGIYRVALPRLVGGYTAHLEVASPVADEPVARVLELVLRDELDDWREGEMFLQSLLTTADLVRDAARHQADLEALLVDARPSA